MRVVTDLVHSLARKFANGITTATPVTEQDAMGIAGTDGTVTIAIGAEAAGRTLTCWTYSRLANQWFKNGPTVADHAITFLPNSRGAFKVEEKAIFFVSSDVAVTDAWTDAERHSANPSS